MEILVFQQEIEKLQEMLRVVDYQSKLHEESLNSQIQTLEQQKIALQTQLNKLKKELEQSQEENIQSLKDYSEDIDKLNIKKEEFKIQLCESNELKGQLELELQNLKEQQQATSDEQANNIILLQQEKEIQLKKINELDEEYKKISIQQQQDIITLQQELNTSQKELSEIDIKNLTNSAQLNDEEQIEIQDSSKLREQLKYLQDSFAKYIVQFEKEQNICKQQKQQLDEMKELNAQLKKQITEINYEMEKNEKNVQNSTLQNENLKKYLENAKVSAQKREEQLNNQFQSTLKELKNDHQENINACSKNNQIQIDRTNKVQQSLEESENEQKNHLEQIKILNQSMLKNKEQMSRKDSELDLLKQNLKYSNEQIQQKLQLINSLEQNMKEFTNLKNQYQDQGKQIERLSELREKEKQVQESLSSQISKLKDTLNEVNQKYNSQITMSTITQQEQKNQIDHFKLTISQLEKGVKEKTQLEKIVDQMKAEIQKQTDERNNLNTKLTVLSTQINEKQSLILEREQQIYLFQASILELKSQSGYKDQCIASIQNQADELLINRKAYEEKYEAQVNGDKMMIEELKSKNKELQQALQKGDEEIQEKKHEIVNMHKSIKKLQEMEQINEQLQDELYKSKYMIGDLMNCAMEIGGMEMVDKIQQALGFREYH